MFGQQNQRRRWKRIRLNGCDVCIVVYFKSYLNAREHRAFSCRSQISVRDICFQSTNIRISTGVCRGVTNIRKWATHANVSNSSILSNYKRKLVNLQYMLTVLSSEPTLNVASKVQYPSVVSISIDHPPSLEALCIKTNAKTINLTATAGEWGGCFVLVPCIRDTSFCMTSYTIHVYTSCEVYRDTLVPETLSCQSRIVCALNNFFMKNLPAGTVNLK